MIPSDATIPEQKVVHLLKPRGFCVGVVRAIEIVAHLHRQRFDRVEEVELAG